MKGIKPVQETIALLLRATLLPVIIREFFQVNRVTIIAYHRISAKLFESHMRYLIKNYSIISLEEFIKAKYKKHPERLPSKPIVITIDDGAKSNYALKYVLRKYEIPVTIFVCSDIVGTSRHFWFSHRDEVKTDLKVVPDTERLKLLSQVGFDEQKDYGAPETLSKEQLHELLDSGVSIQSHTLTHPILPMCDDLKAEKEISKSRADLENRFGAPVVCFAYPNGDYLPRDVHYCKRAGYLAAVTMEAGFNDINTDVYRLKRISICDNASINQLAVRACGLWDFLKGILRPQMLRDRLPRSKSDKRQVEGEKRGLEKSHR